MDRYFLQMKKIKDMSTQKEDENFEKHYNKIQNMSYMVFLNKAQKWIEKGCQGHILDCSHSDHSSHMSDDDDNEDSTHRKGDKGASTKKANKTE